MENCLGLLVKKQGDHMLLGLYGCLVIYNPGFRTDFNSHKLCLKTSSRISANHPTEYRHATHENNQMHNSYIAQGFLSCSFQAARFLGGTENESIQNKHI